MAALDYVDVSELPEFTGGRPIQANTRVETTVTVCERSDLDARCVELDAKH